DGDRDLRRCELRLRGRRRHRHEKPGSLADDRGELDRMIEKSAQAVDDGEAEAQADMAICLRAPVELAKDVAPLVFRNPAATVAHFDADLLPAPPAADRHAA